MDTVTIENIILHSIFNNKNKGIHISNLHLKVTGSQRVQCTKINQTNVSKWILLHIPLLLLFD